MRSFYTVFLSLYILFLLLLFFTKFSKYSPWQQFYDVTPENHTEYHDVTPENHTEVHDVKPENHTEVHNVTPQNHIEKALVVVTKAEDDDLWMNDVDPSWTKYTYLVTEDSHQNHSNLTLSVPIVRTLFPITNFHPESYDMSGEEQKVNLPAN